jgi:hypothetical protein
MAENCILLIGLLLRNLSAGIDWNFHDYCRRFRPIIRRVQLCCNVVFRDRDSRKLSGLITHKLPILLSPDLNRHLRHYSIWVQSSNGSLVISIHVLHLKNLPQGCTFIHAGEKLNCWSRFYQILKTDYFLDDNNAINKNIEIPDGSRAVAGNTVTGSRQTRQCQGTGAACTLLFPSLTRRSAPCRADPGPTR